MPNKDNLIPYLIGLGVACLLLGIFLFSTRDAHVELKGKILKVRTHESDENNSVAIIDFRFVNPSGYPFMVRAVTVSVQDAQGKWTEGITMPEGDSKRVLDYYKEMGPKFNDTLIPRARISSKQSLDRMVGAGFPLPVAQLENRKGMKIVVEEVDGPVSEILEKAQ